MERITKRFERTVTELVKLISTHQSLSYLYVLINNSLWFKLYDVRFLEGDICTVLLWLGDVELLLITFYTKLNIFNSFLNDNSSNAGIKNLLDVVGNEFANKPVAENYKAKSSEEETKEAILRCLIRPVTYVEALIICSTNSTNEVDTAYEVSTASTQPSTTSTQVNTASFQTSTANLSDATVYAFLANQSTVSQLVHEDLKQIHEDDLEEIDLKWQLALLSIRAKRGPKNQDSRNRCQESSRRTVHVEKTHPKAMVAINGVGFDLSYMAEDEAPTNKALMAFLESEPKFECYGPKTSKSVYEDISNDVKENPDALLVKDRVSDNNDCSVESPVVVEKKTVVPTVPKIEFVRAKQQEKPVRKSVKHMIRNMSYLFEFKEFDGGYVTFGGGAKGGRITCKGTLKTGFRREFSVARTPRQNGVVERRNRTLIESAKTMLADSKLPTTFWAKAINTACYVQNKVLVVKPNNKTPYELFRGRTLALSFMRPFRCHVTILNTLDDLGKFDRESYDGFFVGYSLNSKAFRVYHLRTRKEEENLHIRFLEDKYSIAGNGPEWLFDIDVLTRSMNYFPVVAGTNSNDFVGTEESIGQGILKKFITEIENLVDKKVKVIRCFRREFSVARTPRQNGVVERRNKTLIESAKTMLADSKLPTTFWAKAINTACYVQNKVLVVKPNNKTPYELFRGRTLALSFMRPFRCHVTILNTLDDLGKFDRESYDGFFVGYSLNSKAFRVYHLRTRKEEENLHIRFLEDKYSIAGNGPEWLFDIDVLTRSMNYFPVVAGTNSNDFVGTEESIGQGQKHDELSNKERGPSNELNYTFKNISTEYPDDTKLPGLETIATNDDSKEKAEFTNLESSIQVSPTPTTRIHKDHPLKQVIRSLNTLVQTRSKLKPTNEQGFISAVYEGKTHKDLNTCLFACFLLQIEPTRVSKALPD
nr:putative ribonuclease H-like domain-containing protein [Tanacetum cinerariifolium]